MKHGRIAKELPKLKSTLGNDSTNQIYGITFIEKQIDKMKNFCNSERCY